jgi:hypothetical protein
LIEKRWETSSYGSVVEFTMRRRSGCYCHRIGEEGAAMASGDGDPEGRVLRTGALPVRPDLSQVTRLLRFSIIAKVKEGREEDVLAYGKQVEEAIAASPDVLAPLRLHYLRWVLFDVGSRLHFPVSGHLRYRLRQAHRGRGCVVQPDGDHDGVHQP